MPTPLATLSRRRRAQPVASISSTLAFYLTPFHCFMADLVPAGLASFRHGATTFCARALPASTICRQMSIRRAEADGGDGQTAHQKLAPGISVHRNELSWRLGIYPTISFQERFASLAVSIYPGSFAQESFFPAGSGLPLLRVYYSPLRLFVLFLGSHCDFLST